MALRFSVFKVTVSQLNLDDLRPIADDKGFRDALLDIKKRGQRRRIPISLFGEIVGECDYFHALVKAGFTVVEAIRLNEASHKSEIDKAIKVSAKVPISTQSDVGEVKDALMMLKLGIDPPAAAYVYLKPFIEYLRYAT
jgi:hypothetical protein